MPGSDFVQKLQNADLFAVFAVLALIFADLARTEFTGKV